LEFSEFYNTPQHVGWFTILCVEELNIFNLIHPVRYRFRQMFKNVQIYGILGVQCMAGMRNVCEMLIGKNPHHLDNTIHGGI
jgi:hypothetical protein